MDPTPTEVPEAAISEAPPVEPEAPAAEPWGGPTHEDWQRVEQYMQTTGPFLGALAQDIQMARARQAQAYEQAQLAQAQSAEPEFDPFEPRSIQDFIDQRVAMGIQMGMAQAIGPYEGIFQSVASERGEELANTEMDRLTGELGEFNRDVAVMLAAPLIEQGSDPYEALRACAGFAQRFESEVRNAERQRLTGEVSQLRGGRAENSPYAVGAANEEPSYLLSKGKAKYEDAVRRVLSTRHPINPVR